MKKGKKVLVLLLSAVLLVGVTITGTLAYLTSTKTVTNTFTVGRVAITMVETAVDVYGVPTSGTNDGNEYKLIPGHTYTKEPIITVSDDSEDCWLFVKIDNGLGEDGIITMESGWTKVENTENVWALDTVSVAKSSAIPFKSVTFDENADPSQYSVAKIDVTAYAIQADGLEDMTPAERWNLFSEN